jgi:hypothetical protein
MRSIITFISALLFCTTFGYANNGNVVDLSAPKKDSSWTSKGIINVTFGQTSFTNWAAGGENSVNGNFLFNYTTTYRKDKIEWDNNFELAYGGMLENRSLYKKTNDKLNFSTKYGYKASEKWNYSYHIGLNTQMANGYKYPNDSVPISKFMAPGYILAGLGMDYFPFKGFSILLSPITYKLTVVNDPTLANQGSFGVEPAIIDSNGVVTSPPRHFINEPGGFVKMQFEKSIKEAFTVRSKLELFSSYIKNPQNLDVNWNTLISYKFTKYFATTLAIDIIYDEDAKIKVDGPNNTTIEVGPRTQVREVLSFGLSFKL